TVNRNVPPFTQASEKEAVVTFTGSVNVTTRLLPVEIPIAPLAGLLASTAGASSTLKVSVKLAAMLSGGSLVSVSVTLAAKTVRVQVSPGFKAAIGEISNDVA